MSLLRIIQPNYYLDTHKFCRTTLFKSKTFASLRNYGVSNNEANLSPCKKMEDILQKRFPKAKKIVVNDMSGGCGSMYEIFVETVEFEGLPLVKQHMLVNETLKEQIKSMHGLRVKTKVADVS